MRGGIFGTGPRISLRSIRAGPPSAHLTASDGHARANIAGDTGDDRMTARTSAQVQGTHPGHAAGSVAEIPDRGFCCRFACFDFVFFALAIFGVCCPV